MTYSLIFVQAHAQETQRIQRDSGTRGNKFQTVFYVLKDSPQVKHGPFEYYIQDKLATSGFYYHGLRDSVWKSYSRNGVYSQRVYHKGVKAGVWENRNAQGELTYAYDFDNGKAIVYAPESRPDSVDFYIQLPNGKWGKDETVSAPVDLFTKYTWQSFLNRNLRYPMDAIDREVQGTVVVAIIFDESGHANSYEIISKADPSLNEEALRVIKLFDYEYAPATKDGKNVRFVIKQPIVFRLERG